MSNPRHTDGREIVFWEVDPDREYLHCETIAEAVFDWADRVDGPLPQTVVVHGFARMRPSPVALASHVLQWTLDHLDEEFGDPNNGVSGGTPEITRLVEDFAKRVCELYEPWTCEEVCQMVTLVDSYVKRPVMV